MLKFRLLGIPVNIHWMFWILAAFLGGGLSAKGTQEVHLVLVFIVAAFISILVHELGHALMGLKMGAKTTSIQLHGMGGLTEFPGTYFGRKKGILVTASGPLASIFLALVFWFMFRVLPVDTLAGNYGGHLLLNFFHTMVFINIFWSVINLCPVMPLDGGQILRDFLGPNRLRITCIIGFLALAVLAVLLWALTRSFYNLIILALLGSYTWRVWKEL